MKREPLWRVFVITTSEAEDAVAEWLNSVLGQTTTAYFDMESGFSTVTIYLRRKLDSPGEVREQICTGLKRIKKCGLETGPGKIVISKLRQEDWAESWKRHFKPIEIGKALLIKPSWSKRRPRKGQAAIVLDPGLSFGTGHHPTTAFCLREIARTQESHGEASWGPDGSASCARCQPLSFLDLGTGSGILAIAAAKLGYSPIHALDFDAEAVRVARANARKNRVHWKLKIRRGDVSKLPKCPGRQGQKYDLICANLISDLLISEKRRFAARLKPHGTLVLAGILTKEFPTVVEAYETLGLKLHSCRTEREWCSGSFGL